MKAIHGNEKAEKELIDWLLSGDISIVFQVKRDLLHAGEAELKKLRRRIPLEGWGKRFMDARGENGLWGDGFYLPKWTSTHYTLLDIKNLGFPEGNRKISQSVSLVLNTERGVNGGIGYGRKYSDVCVNGMILNFASYFAGERASLNEIVDFLLGVQMPDGGWNCRYLKGAVHSSLHSTLSVLEGFHEFITAGNSYREDEIGKAEREGVAFLLEHRLYKSRRTGEVIDPKMVKLFYPSRWRFDILRALEYLQNTGVKYDPRMTDALTLLHEKRMSDGSWRLEAKHSGLVHFDMEKNGERSRWNTLRALRVLRRFSGNSF